MVINYALMVLLVTMLDVGSLFTWAIQLMRAYALFCNNRLAVLLLQVGMDISPTSLPQWCTLNFLLIFIMYKNLTQHAICYYSHTFSLVIFTLYFCSIGCWSLSIYNYFTSYQYHSLVICQLLF